jgi:hypothetical protein
MFAGRSDSLTEPEHGQKAALSRAYKMQGSRIPGGPICRAEEEPA